MLYQLSYTPSAEREVASGGGGRKAQRTIGKPIQVPSLPVNTRWVAGR
jgi:hypothetical protein